MHEKAHAGGYTSSSRRRQRSHVRAIQRVGSSSPLLPRDQASQLGSISIEPEHLLLGLLRDGEAIAALGPVSRDDLRKDIEKKVAFRASSRPRSRFRSLTRRNGCSSSPRKRPTPSSTITLVASTCCSDCSARSIAPRPCLAAHGVRLSDADRPSSTCPGGPCRLYHRAHRWQSRNQESRRGPRGDTPRPPQGQGVGDADPRPA